MRVPRFGDGCTGVTWTKEFPTWDYEVACDAMRVDGNDFFCGMTFPVGKDPCSFIVGGWGGTVVGLSSIDGFDASENETTQYYEFERDRWYKIRLRVTPERIEAIVDRVQFARAHVGRAFTYEPESGLFGVFSSAGVDGAFAGFDQFAHRACGGREGGEGPGVARRGEECVDGKRCLGVFGFHLIGEGAEVRDRRGDGVFVQRALVPDRGIAEDAGDHAERRIALATDEHGEFLERLGIEVADKPLTRLAQHGLPPQLEQPEVQQRALEGGRHGNRVIE